MVYRSIKFYIYIHFKIKIAGTSDAEHRFFPLFIGVSSSENSWSFNSYLSVIKPFLPPNPYVLADAAGAITVAAKETGFSRLSCWFHAAQALKNRLKNNYVLNSDLIVENVRTLQLASSTKEFFKGIF
jgi:hypothetical protein